MAMRVDPQAEEPRPKYRYRVTNWAEYDRALVNRGNLTVWFDEATIREGWTPPRHAGRGRQGLYSELAIQTCRRSRPCFACPIGPPKVWCARSCASAGSTCRYPTTPTCRAVPPSSR